MSAINLFRLTLSFKNILEFLSLWFHWGMWNIFHSAIDSPFDIIVLELLTSSLVLKVQSKLDGQKKPLFSL